MTPTPHIWTPGQGLPDGARAQAWLRQERYGYRWGWKRIRDPKVDRVLQLAAAVDNVQGIGVADGASSHTVAITIPSGGCVAAFVMNLGGSETISTMTAGGAGMTAIQGLVDNSGGLAAKNSLYALNNPTTGSSINVTVTWSGTTGSAISMHVFAMTGIVVTSVAAMHRASFAPDGSGGGGVDVNVSNAVSGDLVLAACANFDTGAGTLGVVETLGKLFNAIAGTAYDGGSEYATASGSGKVMAFTGDDFCTNIGCAFIPAAGGVTPTPGAGSELLTGRTNILGFGIGMPDQA